MPAIGAKPDMARAAWWVENDPERLSPQATSDAGTAAVLRRLRLELKHFPA
jgi:hypothetical protein